MNIKDLLSPKVTIIKLRADSKDKANIKVTRRLVLNGTVPYFHQILSVPTRLFLRCPVFYYYRI